MSNALNCFILFSIISGSIAIKSLNFSLNSRTGIVRWIIFFFNCFSRSANLFGPIKASDKIPDYKYKQGAKLPNISVEKFYKDNFTDDLDEYISDEIIDLRAGFYEKFYTPKNATVITLKFLKDGKVVSHWAKHYRGMVLNTLAKKNVQSIAEFMNTQIPGLKLVEIQEKKDIRLLIMDIV